MQGCAFAASPAPGAHPSNSAMYRLISQYAAVMAAFTERDAERLASLMTLALSPASAWYAPLDAASTGPIHRLPAAPRLSHQPSVLRLRADGAPAAAHRAASAESARRHGIHPLVRHVLRTVAQSVGSGRRLSLLFASCRTRECARASTPARPADSARETPVRRRPRRRDPPTAPIQSPPGKPTESAENQPNPP